MTDPRRLYDLRSNEYLVREIVEGNDSGTAAHEVLLRLGEGEKALRLLAEIVEIAESLNEHIAVHGTGACNGVRNRIQSIHGLAATPDVEGWGSR